MKTSRRDSGMVLIFVLGILALLAMLVAAFAVETGTELEMTANHRDGERARLVARAGLERAKYELRRSATTPNFPQPWAMADLWNYNTNSIMPQLGNPTPPSNIVTTVSPSFGVVMPARPAGITFNSALNPRGLPWPSGYVASTYYSYDPNSGFHGDYYVLKVTDCNSLIDLSDQNPNIASMVKTLATVVGAPDAATMGTTLYNARPAGGYRRLEEVQGVLSKTYGVANGGADFTAVAPYLTCIAYVDGRVIYMGPNPNFPLPPPLTITPRAPINVNMAPYPVLVAAFNGIAGKSRNNTNYTVSLAQAKALAGAVIAFRNSPVGGRYGFSSWSQFASFLGLEAGTGQQGKAALSGAGGWSRELAALILADCNPNTNLNQLVPDASIYQCFDKTQVTQGTTELCFEPGGTFMIDSLGVILDATGNQMAASAECLSTVRVWTQYNETNQTDFELNRVDPPGATGLTGLKDFTTLPECRNAMFANVPPDSNNIAVSSLRGSLYDGQITFNTITECSIGPNSTYCGNIDGTINATRSGSTTYSTTGGSTTTPRFPGGGQGGDGQSRLGNYANASPATHPQVARTNDSSTPPGASNSPVGNTASWTAWGGTLGDVNGGTVANPNFFAGSDLHPTAAVVGRGGAGNQNRKIMYLQSQTLVTSEHDYNQITLTMGINLQSNLGINNTTNATQTSQSEHGNVTVQTFGGTISHYENVGGSVVLTTNEAENSGNGQIGNVTVHSQNTQMAGSSSTTQTNTYGSSSNDHTVVTGTLTAVVPPLSIYSLDRQTFQFWMKPGQLIPGTTTYWDGTQWVGATGQTLVLMDWHSGQPVPAGDSVNVTLADQVSSGINQDSSLFQAARNQQGNINTDGSNNSSLGNGADNSSGNGQVGSGDAGSLMDSTSTAASSLDAGNDTAAQSLMSANGLLGQIAQGSESCTIHWGAETHLVIYAMVVPGGLQICAQFSMPQKSDAGENPPARMSGSYIRDWAGPTVQPGTWHHVIFPMRVPNSLPDPQQISGGNKNTAFIVDGTTIASAEPAWPTESDPDARLIEAAYDKMLADYNAMFQAFQALDNQAQADAQAAAQAQDFTNSVSVTGNLQAVSANQTTAISCDSSITTNVDWSPMGTSYTLTGTDKNQVNVSNQGITSVSITPPAAYNSANYPSPVRIPPGRTPAQSLVNECLPGWTPGNDGVCIWVGGVSPNDTVAASDNHVANSLDFFGLIDNLVIDGDLANGTGQGIRYNTFQPSTGGASGPAYFQKHVPALEWDKPVIVLSQRATAWTQSGGADTVDLGTTEMFFGWLPVGSSSPTVFGHATNPNNPNTPPAALQSAGGGWTNPDNAGGQSSGWNTVLNATILPQRNAGANQFNGSGFLTTSAAGGGAEQYFYSIQVTPPAAGPGGPPMTPIIDDVKILYMPWDCAVVLQEENVD